MIQFAHDSDTVDVNQPLWGYKTPIQMKIDIQKSYDGVVHGFDSGAAYDRRSCLCRFEMDGTTQTTFNTFFNDSTKGRGAEITLKLGTTSGFFPFGPDLGDTGDFVVRVKYQPSGMKLSPWLWYKSEIEMFYISGPAYSWSDTSPDGVGADGSGNGFDIGTAGDMTENLWFPQSGFEPTIGYAVETIRAYNGDAFSKDMGSDADLYETTFRIEATNGKMANLIDNLTTNGRFNDITMITPDNYYPFGKDKPSAATYIVKMLENNLEIVHVRPNLFSTQLSFQYVSHTV